VNHIATEIDSVKPESNARGWKYFADQINTIWKKSAGDFIQCGQLLIDAKTELANDAFAALVKKLAFDRSVGTKLMAIAENSILCAHVHDLPASWSTLYELSQLRPDVLEVAFADGTITSRMLRKDALALKPRRTSTGNTANSSTASQLGNAWDSSSADQRSAFLNKLGHGGLCAAMSVDLQAKLRDHVIGLAFAGASKASSFALNATDKLHVALRCAEQPDPDTEAILLMKGALTCILSRADARGVTRSNIVIAEGKSKNWKK
jgi:hypothetical protein